MNPYSWKFKLGNFANWLGLTLSNGQVITEIHQKRYTCLGIVEMDKIKEKAIKEILESEYKRRLKLVFKSKLNGRNKTLVINAWAVSALRYGEGNLKWTVDELKNMNRKTRQFMTMHGAFHPRQAICDYREMRTWTDQMRGLYLKRGK